MKNQKEIEAAAARVRAKQEDLETACMLAELLTVNDLERLLKVDKRTIQRLCKRGQLPLPLKLGGLNRWRFEDIQAAIDRLDHRVGRKIPTVATVEA